MIELAKPLQNVYQTFKKYIYQKQILRILANIKKPHISIENDPRDFYCLINLY